MNATRPSSKASRKPLLQRPGTNATAGCCEAADGHALRSTYLAPLFPCSRATKQRSGRARQLGAGAALDKMSRRDDALAGA